MPSPIPFISQLDAVEKQLWLARLKSVLPEERFVLFEDMTDFDKNESQLAVVANPDPKHLLALKQLTWVQSLWAGVERLMTEVGEQPFEIVRLIDPFLSLTMAEAVLAWTLYLHRDMPRYRSQQLNKCWQQLPYVPANKRKVGILGLGELGQASAKALVRNNFDVMGWSKSKKHIEQVNCFSGEEGLASMVSQSDILICLLPLTSDTYHIINDRLLSLLPVGASLINFSRGAVLDTPALLKYLGNTHLTHAVLDVFEQEPLENNSELWTHANITVLPHISAPTNIQTACNIVAKNIRQYREFGMIPTAVDKIKGY